jgi:hypothetical protein
VDAGVKIPDSAGEGVFQSNRRILNKELRMSKSAGDDPRLSFACSAVLLFGRKRTKKKVSFGPAEEGSFQNGVDTIRVISVIRG